MRSVALSFCLPDILNTVHRISGAPSASSKSTDKVTSSATNLRLLATFQKVLYFDNQVFCVEWIACSRSETFPANRSAQAVDLPYCLVQRWRRHLSYPCRLASKGFEISLCFLGFNNPLASAIYSSSLTLISSRMGPYPTSLMKTD